ncbi:MAG TPA: enoyl-CoA hydratase/isomerase family protein [Miltoncostaeaceae bacterium]|nr:enoyl-CoA hydratase/isomerase family protein [Miltoncostaeaceae bacterium]
MPAEPTSPGGRLLVEEDGPALILRISNPGRANALDEPILDALASLLHAPPPAARAVLLAGEGDRHFSAGLDLAGAGAEPAGGLRDGERRLGAAAAAIADCPLPVIGVLNGAAVGGALELAIACDWRIARAGARLAMPAARIGVVYAAEGLRRFVAAMGPGRARRLFLTGVPVEAEEALAMGLVEQVVERAALWTAARAAAAEVAAGAPLALAGTRAVVRALSDGSPPADVEEVARRWRERAFASADFVEGLAAFHDRRPPNFGGR